MPNDMDDLVQSDANKAQNAWKQYKRGNWKPNFPKLLESVMWSLCILSVVFIVGALPFVGEEKAIPGEVWMGLGTLGIVGFGLCAMLIRLISRSFGDADKTMSQAFERGR